jgi:hypothetical protein
MNKKRLLIAVVVSFVVAVMIGLLSLEIVSAQECRLIKIHGRTEHPTIMIEPETIYVSKGDCVVWFNRVTAKEIQVIFVEGKRCLDVTNAPMGFSLNAQSCYVTSWIPFAGISSLRFVEKGTYNYVVEAKGMQGIKAKGQIIVE